MFNSLTLVQVLVSGIGVGCIYGLIAIGFCVIYNASGIVNFAQGAFVMLGGMLTHLFMTRYGFPMPLAGLLAVVAVIIIGVAIERLIVRPLWNRDATMFAMILATLAVQIVIERCALLFLGDQPKALPVFTDLPPITLGSVAVSYQLLWNVGASLMMVVILGLFFKKTLIGKALRACSVNRQAAQLQGIPVSLMLSLAFAISAGLGAVAGILIAPTQYTAFNVGTPFAISGFIAAIIGGFGRPVGAFLGGLVLGVSQSFASIAFGSGQKNIVALTILLIFLFVRPTGIVGKPAEK